MAILHSLNQEQEIAWMIDLGAQLTISARGAYPLEVQQGSLTHLVAFNELQHQIYGRIRALRRKDEWTIESFVDGLLQRAQHYGVAGDLGWALKTSLSMLGNQ